jgi:MtN3 and saliva related transmembrane protein
MKASIFCYFGFIAGTLSTLSFIPQLVKIIRSRSTTDISLIAFTLLGAGVAFWIGYGIFINSVPVMLFNAITLALVVTIISLKVRYK